MSENLCENLLENLREKGVKKKTVVEQSDGTFFHTIFAPRFFGNFDPETQEKNTTPNQLQAAPGPMLFFIRFSRPGRRHQGRMFSFMYTLI